ncbi:ABC-2 type transport system ATP-binding protein [Brevibacterium sp. Mu109]|uniref:ABC transporter ATP-binding protein n=1 Tax=Brevibacterium sp. Mu109 TaxID=1255669 RepID=UPI000C6455EA|nr:ABC transporter ATP-binding protein [Brevibacterium sp. Mu109]SMX93207.1 ABC-2 type transport system ATP-binding protein [Brevibacterium sp. Mu109]
MNVTDAAHVSRLVAGYGDTEVLGPVDLSLRPGVTALLGRNGSGKTTLMRTLCGIIPALSGTCTVLGSAVADGAAIRSRVGYLGHESALASALTVEENLRFWENITSTYPDAIVVPAEELVERFDLASLMSKKVSSLSRGQRQRVDLARLAMTDPEFIVLDEPLTGLDPVYAAQTRALLSEWGETRTVLYSTHSVPEALELARHFLIVQGRDLIELDCDYEAVTETTILDVLEAHA